VALLTDTAATADAVEGRLIREPTHAMTLTGVRV
jgi:hypothetical protein